MDHGVPDRRRDRGDSAEGRQDVVVVGIQHSRPRGLRRLRLGRLAGRRHTGPHPHGRDQECLDRDDRGVPSSCPPRCGGSVRAHRSRRWRCPPRERRRAPSRVSRLMTIESLATAVKAPTAGLARRGRRQNGRRADPAAVRGRPSRRVAGDSGGRRAVGRPLGGRPLLRGRGAPAHGPGGNGRRGVSGGVLPPANGHPVDRRLRPLA
jgi:hypothetical protein